MPEYWENPANPGIPAPPPKITFESWVARRPSHLASEIVRAEQHLLAHRESVAKLTAKFDMHKTKLDEAARMEGEAHTYYHLLRQQAADEFPDGLDDELAAAAQRHALQIIRVPDKTPMIQKKKHWWSRKPSPVTPENGYAFPSTAEFNVKQGED